MESIKIKIATDFTPTPGARYVKEGKWSGEEFRHEKLYPAFKKAIQEGKKIIVDLDGTAGYGTSFLEEAFGGLIREEKIDYSKIEPILEIISNEERYLIEDIRHYLKDAANESKK